MSLQMHACVHSNLFLRSRQQETTFVVENNLDFMQHYI